MLKLMIAALLALQAAPAFRVSGTVTREDNLSPQQPNQVNVRLTGETLTFSAPIGADGSFQAPRIPPGRYQLVVGPNVTMEGVPVVVVDKDVTGVQLVVPRVSPLGTLRISSTVDGGGPRPRFQLTLTKIGAAPETIPFTTQISGNAAVQRSAGEYRLSVTGLPNGYSLRAATNGSTDVLNQPLKVSTGDTLSIGLTFGVTSPPPWAKVTGRYKGTKPMELFLINNGGGELIPATFGPDSTFEFAKVLPGTYSAEGSTPVGIFSASITVPAGKDLTDVVINTPVSKEIPGRVAISGSAIPRIGIQVVPPRPAQQGAGPVLVQNQQYTALPTPDGKFTITLPEIEGRASLNQNLIPPGFVLKSFTYGAVDLLKDPLKVSAADTSELQLTFESSGLPPVSVSGRVNGLSPTATNARVFLVATATNEMWDAPINADGSFVFAKVLPGQYQARLSYASAQATAPVRVANTDTTGVVLNYNRQFMITGQVVVDGASIDTPAPPLTVETRSADGSGTPMTVRSPVGGGVFRIMVGPGDYKFSVQGLSSDYEVKAITYGDIDLLKNSLKLDEWPIWHLILKVGRK